MREIAVAWIAFVVVLAFLWVREGRQVPRAPRRHTAHDAFEASVNGRFGRIRDRAGR